MLAGSFPAEGKIKDRDLPECKAVVEFCLSKKYSINGHDPKKPAGEGKGVWVDCLMPVAFGTKTIEGLDRAAVAACFKAVKANQRK